MSRAKSAAVGLYRQKLFLAKVRYFLVLAVLFGGIFFASYMAEAESTVISTLKCEQAQDINSPGYIQGSEKYFDLEYTSDDQIKLSYSTPEKSRSTLFKAEDSESVSWDPLGGEIFARWSSGAYMTLRDFNSEWRGYLMFPSNVDPASNPFAMPEIELRCGIVKW